MNPHPDRRPRQRNSPLWLVLFGLPFLLIGLGVLLVGMVPTIHDAWRMRQWQAVQAELLEARLERQRGSKGSITYIARARFSYELAGVRYEAQRVAINGASDNVGDFWINLGRRLERAHQRGQPVTAWVDPADPGQAVLDRTLRWPLLAFWAAFGVLFAGVGAGLITGAVYTHRKASAPPHPEARAQPWLAHAAWSTPAISSQARAEGWVLVVAGTVFSLVGVAVSVAALPAAWNGRPIVWVVLLFPLVGLLLLGQAFRHWRRVGRYGNPSLLLDPHPAPLGGRAGFRLALPVAHQPGLRFDVALSALDRHTSGSGKNRSTRERLDWETEGQAQIEATAEGIRLRWSAELPARLGPSAAPDSNGRVWRVDIKGHGPVADFGARFEVPVFDTGRGQAGTTQTDGQADDPWGDRHHADQAIARERLQTTCQTRMDMEGALVLTQPYRRQWAMKAVWLVVGLLFLGVGAFMAHQKGGAFWMGAAFASVGLLMASTSFWSMATRRSARLGRHVGLQARRHFLGLPVRSQHWPADAVQHLEQHMSYSMQASGQRPEHIVQVRAFRQGGGHVVLADGISGEAAARLLMADIARHTGWVVRP